MSRTIKIDSGNPRDYYCSMKFKYLKIDLESFTTYNCHAATPHTVDFAWLDKNPGKLFNTDVNVSERKQMLENNRNASCEQNCWAAEDVGAISPRILQEGYVKSHTEFITSPEIIDLTVGGDCNLTCSYCCKEYSTAWRRDIVKNGSYKLSTQTDDRFSATSKDKVLLKIKQAELKHSSKYQTLLSEIQHYAPVLKELIVTGGEPLLDNFLIEILGTLKLENNTRVELYTGLGLSTSRFSAMIDKLKLIPNLRLRISAECTNELLEFNRYGIKWSEFVDKVQLIRESGIDFVFACTLSNLTMFGFQKFYETFGDERTIVTFAYQPTFMAPYVMDSKSKLQLAEQFQSLPNNLRDQLIASMQNPADENSRIGLQEFLTQFVARRPGLSLDIYPKTFRDWLEDVV